MLCLHFYNYSINIKHKTFSVKHWCLMVALNLDRGSLYFHRRKLLKSCQWLWHVLLFFIEIVMKSKRVVLVIIFFLEYSKIGQFRLAFRFSEHERYMEYSRICFNTFRISLLIVTREMPSTFRYWKKIPYENMKGILGQVTS